MCRDHDEAKCSCCQHVPERPLDSRGITRVTFYQPQEIMCYYLVLSALGTRWIEEPYSYSKAAFVAACDANETCVHLLPPWTSDVQDPNRYFSEHAASYSPKSAPPATARKPLKIALSPLTLPPRSRRLKPADRVRAAYIGVLLLECQYHICEVASGVGEMRTLDLPMQMAALLAFSLAFDRPLAGAMAPVSLPAMAEAHQAECWMRSEMYLRP